MHHCMNKSTIPNLTTLIPSLLSHGLFSQALKASASLLPDPRLTDQIYSLSLKSGRPLDPHRASFLIHRLSLSGHLPRSHRILLDMPQPDTVAYNALISAYSETRQPKPAFQLFNRLRHSNQTPDIYTLTSLLKSCNESSQANAIAHALILKMGFSSNAFVISSIVSNYSKCGESVYAEKYFREFLILDSIVWTALISGFVQNGEWELGKAIFLEMRVLGLGVNEFTLTSILGAFAGDSYDDIEQGRKTHGLSVKMGFLSGFSTPLSNAVMSMYLRCGCEVDGIRVFEEILEPDVVSWTLLVGAYDGEKAVEVFRFLFSSGIEMNEYTMINVLSAISNDPRLLLRCGRQIHGCCWKGGYLYVVSVANSLITMYGRCRQIDGARQVFDEMLSRDCVSWNALIAGYAENGLVDKALGMFSWMQQHSSLKPTKYTLASILEVISGATALKQGMQIHSYIIKSGFVSDDSMSTGLIITYGKCDGIEESKQVFDEIERRDVVQVNAMAAAFVHSGYHADTLNLFQSIWSSGMAIDSGTFSIVFKACGSLTAMEQGSNVHALVLKSGIDQDDFIGSAIIDVYCKCGNIDYAVKAFKEIPKENLAAWNAMITGYAHHGYHDEALDLYKKMAQDGIDPDELTFLGVLYSCCHAGCVKEATNLMNSMYEDHGILPCLEHYACLVDLFGRVGDLEAAKRSIDLMTVEPDARIWQIFLSACSVYGNVELGMVAAQELLKLQPENDSAYVLLSNIYASAGMWDEVGRIRKSMKERIVSKAPGLSWVQVKGTMHSFFANDMSHPQIEEIYFWLKQLNKHMIETEYRDWETAT
ncbi:hypothetical protein AAC387_Pa01g3512 [Persea americana]